MRRLSPHPFIWSALIAFACNGTDKQATPHPTGVTDQPVVTGKYSPAFGLRLDTLLDTYHQMVSGFSQPGAQGNGSIAQAFQHQLDNLSFEEFKKDTLVFQTVLQQKGNTLAEMKGLLGETSLSGQRQELNIVSQDLYDMLRTVRYSQKTVYFMECSSAFGEDKPGNWISATSDTSQLVNPFGAPGHCGVIRDSLPGHP